MSISWETILNTFEKSINRQPVVLPISRFSYRYFVDSMTACIVDLFAWKPYWFLEIRLFSLKYSTNHLCIHFSSTFPGSGSMVIGLQFDICSKFPYFGIGETIPIFQLSGNMVVCNDLLKNVINSSGLCIKNCFRICVGIFWISEGL